MHIEIPAEEVVQVASEKPTARHGQSLRKIEEAVDLLTKVTTEQSCLQ